MKSVPGGASHELRNLAIATLAAGACFAAGTGPLLAQSRELAFDVQLDGRAIGSHVFRIAPGGEGRQRVESTAKFDVKLLGIRVYRYRHHAVEQWNRGCVQQLEATTDDNGDSLTVQGTRTQGEFRLEQPEPGSISGDCLSTYVYWDLEQLRKQRHLLNPQTGKWDAARLESVGDAKLQRRSGPVTAHHYRLHAAELVIDLWYSPDGEWLQLGSDARGNRRLMYLRRD